MIILLNLISLNNNIAQFDDRAVRRRPRGASTARHDRAGWTGKNLILDEALSIGNVKTDSVFTRFDYCCIHLLDTAWKQSKFNLKKNEQMTINTDI